MQTKLEEIVGDFTRFYADTCEAIDACLTESCQRCGNVQFYEQLIRGEPVAICTRCGKVAQ